MCTVHMPRALLATLLGTVKCVMVCYSDPEQSRFEGRLSTTLPNITVLVLT